MSPEINKVSNCCGDRLCLKSGGEETSYYECFACKKPCDGVQDCADCFPKHYPFKQGKPCLCVRNITAEQEKVEGICEEHCWSRKYTPLSDHSDCDKCCVCNVSYIEATRKEESGTDFHKRLRCIFCNSDEMGGHEHVCPIVTGKFGEKYEKQPPEKLATIIGGLILNCGNLYNENKQDITKQVGEYIYKTYSK